jgi:hypothetical protein
VTVYSAAASIPSIREALERGGIAVRRLEAIRPSMEDVFVALIEDEERKVP